MGKLKNFLLFLKFKYLTINEKWWNVLMLIIWAEVKHKSHRRVGGLKLEV